MIIIFNTVDLPTRISLALTTKKLTSFVMNNRVLAANALNYGTSVERFDFPWPGSEARTRMGGHRYILPDTNHSSYINPNIKQYILADTSITSHVRQKAEITWSGTCSSLPDQPEHIDVSKWLSNAAVKLKHLRITSPFVPKGLVKYVSIGILAEFLSWPPTKITLTTRQSTPHVIGGIYDAFHEIFEGIDAAV